MSLKYFKSPGPANIGPRLVKESSQILSMLLVHIYNLSLRTGVVPAKLELAKVIPILKGDRNLVSNYRAISRLSIFDKLLEKVVSRRLYSHLQTNNFLNLSHFGFRHSRSTAFAFIEVIDNILAHLDLH
jgi:hypothetical protein